MPYHFYLYAAKHAAPAPQVLLQKQQQQASIPQWQWPVQVDTIIDQVSAESTAGEQANLAAAKEQSNSNPNRAG